MSMKTVLLGAAFFILHSSFFICGAVALTGCFGSKSLSASGGEVTGASGRAFTEPTPHGMTLIRRGHLKMGIDKKDSLWGKQTPVRDISVDGFWMDEYEVTN